VHPIRSSPVVSSPYGNAPLALSMSIFATMCWLRPVATAWMSERLALCLPCTIVQFGVNVCETIFQNQLQFGVKFSRMEE
jgi:hypothetical protein